MKTKVQRALDFVTFLIALTIIASSTWAQPPDTVWTRRISGEEDNAASAVIPTSDTGVLIVGAIADSFAAQSDALLIKLDSSGNVEWERRYGGAEDEVLSDGVEVASGGYVVAGYSDSYVAGERCAYVLRLTGAGDTLWSRVFCDIFNSRAYAVDELQGGFVVAGSRGDIEGQNFYAFQLTLDGDTVWTRDYRRDVNGPIDDAIDIQARNDGSCIIVGRISDQPEFPGIRQFDLYALTIAASGDTLRSSSFGNENADEVAMSVSVSGSDVAIAGYVARPEIADNMLTLLTDDQGNVIWEREYDRSFDTDYATTVVFVNDQCTAVLGGTREWVGNEFRDRPILIRYSPTGDTLWTRTYDAPQPFDVCAGGLTLNGGYVLGGTTRQTSWPFRSDIWVMRTLPDQTNGLDRQWIIPTHTAICAYPNPTNAGLQVELTVTLPGYVMITINDLLGRCVARLCHEFVNPGRHVWHYSAVELSSGKYFLRATTRTQKEVYPIIILR